MNDSSGRFVVVGQIAGPHGIKGWVKVLSYTDPRSNLFDYSPWHLRHGTEWRTCNGVTGRQQGKGWVAKFDGCDDRTAALAYKSVEIAVHRDQLPPTEQDEYYWADLIGLMVTTTEGVRLGKITQMLATGANDVIIVDTKDKQYLIPFVMDQVVRKVDVNNAQLVVDWDPDF